MYDASAKASDKAPSLNDRLETAKPPMECLNMKSFLFYSCCWRFETSVPPSSSEGRRPNALKSHWLEDTESKEIETLRFTRVPFGLTSSPFLLGGVIELSESREL